MSLPPAKSQAHSSTYFIFRLALSALGRSCLSNAAARSFKPKINSAGTHTRSTATMLCLIKIALVGLNGAGKSTLVKLLCGLYRPTQGTIFINGRPQEEYSKEEYFSLLAVVFQDVKLLPMTIAQNVASDVGTHIDRERVRECLTLSGLWQKVSSLPQKEDTPLGASILDDGIALSGGENQKLWMARALYKNAPMLLLDEPTAALDPLAEQQIYQKYMEMVEGRTSVFISHRLASTRFCDRILLLENGTIIEQGTHDELICLNGRYAQLFEIQGKYYRVNKDGAEEACA